MRLNSRVKRLEKQQQVDNGEYLMCLHYPDEDFVHYQGQQIPLAEWEAMVAANGGTSVTLQLNWGDEDGYIN